MLNKLNLLFKNRLGIFFFAIIFFFSGILFQNSIIDKHFLSNKYECLTDLIFINPEPGCEIFEKKTERMANLQLKLQLQVDGYLLNKKAGRISVFTRDLTTQRFAGVNEGDIFFMASLLKLPLVIAYYRLSEITPDLLTQKLTYTDTLDEYSVQSMQPKKKLEIGKNYMVKDLAYRALAFSDNSASALLRNNFVSDDYLNKVLLAIGLQIKKDGEEEDLITAKSYGLIFRMLYNSSFLERNFSNEILKMLSESDFTDGATKYLPKDIVVAHKFGERTAVNINNEVEFRQLHDCGIVYAKNGKEPYTFCIMTEGQSFEDLKTIIQVLSKTIYENMQE